MNLTRRIWGTLLLGVTISIMRGQSTKTSQTVTRTWTAFSRTAMSITGDVILTSDLIASLNTLTLLKTVVLPMRLIREIDKQHLSDIAEILDAPPTLSSARLYKAHVSRSTKLVNGNTICGPRDAEWLLLGETRDRLSLAVFSGDIEPALDSKSVAKSRDLCGTFSYDAAATE